jgi:hypothetical protein
MTEAQWLACTDPKRMLDFVRGKASERKPRLFARACRSSLWDFLSQKDTGRKVAEEQEPFTDAIVARSGLPGWLRAAIVRDIFGNPFRPVVIERSWLTGNAGAAADLAQVLYDECAFDRLPILSDALEEAGCTDAAILSHLRGPGPHVPGCWPLDLLTGRE